MLALQSRQPGDCRSGSIAKGAPRELLELRKERVKGGMRGDHVVGRGALPTFAFAVIPLTPRDSVLEKSGGKSGNRPSAASLSPLSTNANSKSVGSRPSVLWKICQRSCFVKCVLRERPGDCKEKMSVPPM